ncbi:hypothetical protein M422DRAFT_261475 [Sphaerobolus stellatus SS14]|uniref:Uncharacterized protein n=1 Tax=Sphaerobolus stellatus (strain SS14) TaxID=990650 RepID=A0A0C9U082_SPHS4|nr:hypothetical protein M422DRAFT_261475 [Sphaerobolus stellatus SS14]
MQEEAVEKNTTCMDDMNSKGKQSLQHSARLTGTARINIGLDLEMQLQNICAKIALSPEPTMEIEHPYALQEEETLRLPSDLNHGDQEQLGLKELVIIDHQLQICVAYDAMKKLHNTMELKSFFAAIQRAGKQVDKWMEVYWNSQKAMIQSRGSKEPIEGKLHVLHDDDCVMLSKWMEQHRYWQTQCQRAEAEAAADSIGGRTELPWIWKMNYPDKINDVIAEAIKECTLEDWHSNPITLIRLEWLHAQASRDRFLKELKLLQAESECAVKAFQHFERQWKGKAEMW